MTDKQRRAAAAVAFTPELRAAAEEFRALYGSAWKEEMFRFHNGRPSDEGEHLIAEMRQIRNRVSPNPILIAELLG